MSETQDIHYCVVCHKLGFGDTPAEYHHIREGRLGKRGKLGIWICVYHHRIGPDAIHVMGKKAWQAKFGITERELV
jgi:hypothetical protein